jgi:hypothetical protein
MAFNYDTSIKNILLSMSLSPYLPTGSSVGYGFQMTYDEGATASLAGAITMYDEGILSTGTASLQIFVPTASYLTRRFTSQSIAALVTEYTDFPTGTADEVISTQIIVAPGEIAPLACSATCYQGELQWSFAIGSQLFSPGSYTSLANRQTQRPLKGGVSITSTSKSTPFTNAGSVGTMGLICQDSASGALVGLTNNHVVIRDAFYTSQRTYVNPQNEFDLVDSSNTIQGDYIYQTGESQPVNPGGANEIGRVLRYVPIYTSASIVANPSLTNKVDAAIFSLYCTSSTGQTIIDFSSLGGEQVGLTYGNAIPFASTAEIDNLLNNNYEFYSSGRTTGAKGSPGTLCPLRMFSYTSFPIMFKLQGTNTLSYFTDVIAYVKPADGSSYNPSTVNASTQVCSYPVWGGDSGSTLIANIGGVWKIIGLVFAGNGTPYDPQTNYPVTSTGAAYQVASTIGFACRIDQVAEQLQIKMWTGSIAPVVDHSTITYRTVSGSNSTKTLNCSGSTYWQVGLTEKHNIC